MLNWNHSGRRRRFYNSSMFLLMTNKVYDLLHRTLLDFTNQVATI